MNLMSRVKESLEKKKERCSYSSFLFISWSSAAYPLHSPPPLLLLSELAE